MDPWKWLFNSLVLLSFLLLFQPAFTALVLLFTRNARHREAEPSRRLVRQAVGLALLVGVLPVFYRLWIEAPHFLRNPATDTIPVFMAIAALSALASDAVALVVWAVLNGLRRTWNRAGSVPPVHFGTVAFSIAISLPLSAWAILLFIGRSR